MNRRVCMSPFRVLERIHCKVYQIQGSSAGTARQRRYERAERHDTIDVLLPIVVTQQIPIYEQNPYQHGVLKKHGQFEFSSQSLFTCAIYFRKTVVDA